MESASQPVDPSQSATATYLNTGSGSQRHNVADGWSSTNEGLGNQYVAQTMNIVTNGQNELSNKAEFLKDLYETDPWNDREDRKLRKGWPVRGTCEWIMDTDIIRDWICPKHRELVGSKSHNVVWLHGNPGQGKSTMAICLTEALSRSFSNDKNKEIIYFFCDSGNKNARSANSILRGLLFQLFKANPSFLTDDMLQSHKQLGKNLFVGFAKLWSFLIESAAREGSFNIYCVIDGLDECETDSTESLLRQIKHTFENGNSGNNLSILILSRPYEEIGNYLNGFQKRDLASFSESGEDISRFIEHKVETLAKMKGYSMTIKTTAKEILETKAEGTFLWVGLVCEELSKLYSRDVVGYLEKLPKGLSSLYSGIFSSLLETEERGSEDHRRILSFIAVSVRPLTLLELSDACRLDLDHDIETRVHFMRDRIAEFRLLAIIIHVEHECTSTFEGQCRCISNVDYTLWEETLENERVVLLHQSVKDFMCGHFGNYFPSEPDLHAKISYRCLDELTWPQSRTSLQFQPPEPFMLYSTRYWTWHARRAGDKFSIQDEHTKFFALKSPSRIRWLMRLDLRSIFPDWYQALDLTALNIAAQWGIPALVDFVTPKELDELLSRGYFLRSLPPGGPFTSGMSGAANVKSPLEDAVNNGHVEVLARLLETKLPLTIDACKQAALPKRHEREKIINLLLTRRKEEMVRSQTLHSIIAEYYDEDVIRSLMKHPDFKISELWMVGAVNNEAHGLQILQLFLDHFGQQAIVSAIARAINFAATSSSADVTRFFLDRCNVQVTLHMIGKAAAGGVLDTLKLLLQRRPIGAEIGDDILLSVLNRRGDIVECFETIFDTVGEELVISRRLILAALQKKVHAPQGYVAMLEVLFNQRRDQFNIDEDILLAAVRSSGGSESIPYLLARGCKSSEITERVLEAAAIHLDDEEFQQLRTQSGAI